MKGLLARRPARPGTAPSGATERDAAEFAWRVHVAQESWASRADVKASILLALEGGALYAVVSAASNGGLLTRLAGWHRAAELAGLAILLFAVSAAATAVFPRLGRTTKHNHGRHDVIYFGRLRQWNATELRTRLASLTLDEELDALSRQLVQMSRQNWRKHRWVQISLVLALAGILMISAAAVPAL